MQNLRGISLLELMVCVAIIAILATIALASYQKQVITSRRHAALSQLFELQLQQENHRLQHATYAPLQDLQLSPNDYYSFSVFNRTASTFTLRATVKKGTSQTADLSCTQIQINQSMQREPPECW